MGSRYGSAAEHPLLPATPGRNPVSGSVLLYFKADGNLYRKDNAGVETALTAVSGTVIPSIDWVKASVKAASNGPLAGLSGTVVLDGVQTAVGDRVLVKNQASASANGIYVVASGTWARATDADTGPKLVAAQTVVLQGTQAGSVWQTTWKSTDTLNSTSMTWLSTIRPNTTIPGEADFYSPDGTRRLTLDSFGLNVIAGGLFDNSARVHSAVNPGVPVQPGAPTTPAAGQLWWDNDEVAGVASSAIPIGTITAKGDLVVGNGPGVVARQAVGADNAHLLADSTQPNGVRWGYPQTLVVTENAGAAITGPAANQSALYSDDGSALLIKDDSGVTRTVGQIVPDQALSTEYTTTQPASPTAGLKMFARFRARRVPAFVGPTGQDSRLQPALFSNSVSMLRAIANSATPDLTGLAVTILNNALTTATAVPLASTNLFASLVRLRVASTATAGTAGGIRTNTAQWFCSTTANMGGFYFVARFGLSTAASGTRGFVGLSSQTAAYAAGTNPSAQLSQIGFYWDAAQTTMRFISSGTVAGAGVDLGANFSVTTAATNFFEVSIFVPSGAGQYGFWSATRINDGAMASGTFGSVGLSTSTTIPAIGLLLNAHLNYGNGTLAAAHSMDIQSLYVESDN